MPERRHALTERPVPRHVRQPVGAHVQHRQPGQRQRGQLGNIHVCQAEGPEFLYVVEELLEVCPDGVGAEVEGGEAAQADENVVGEDRQSGERGRSIMFDK